jgi:hypothetical protein
VRVPPRDRIAATYVFHNPSDFSSGSHSDWTCSDMRITRCIGEERQLTEKAKAVGDKCLKACRWRIANRAAKDA